MALPVECVESTKFSFFTDINTNIVGGPRGVRDTLSSGVIVQPYVAWTPEWMYPANFIPIVPTWDDSGKMIPTDKFWNQKETTIAEVQKTSATCKTIFLWMAMTADRLNKEMSAGAEFIEHPNNSFALLQQKRHAVPEKTEEEQRYVDAASILGITEGYRDYQMESLLYAVRQMKQLIEHVSGYVEQNRRNPKDVLGDDDWPMKADCSNMRQRMRLLAMLLEAAFITARTTCIVAAAALPHLQMPTDEPATANGEAKVHSIVYMETAEQSLFMQINRGKPRPRADDASSKEEEPEKKRHQHEYPEF